ncbi:hypothetical protein AGMMS49949_09120 [Alphaproteobacteria bacterium]|nr:hypothetical protein AGMMS49949_09120 [Alphaproteobacteria bacterium]GHT00058.1 hypothetical protein AGMMS50296_8310 [Alphaproteobacteria bacterium]
MVSQLSVSYFRNGGKDEEFLLVEEAATRVQEFYEKNMKILRVLSGNSLIEKKTALEENKSGSLYNSGRNCFLLKGPEQPMVDFWQEWESLMSLLEEPFPEESKTLIVNVNSLKSEKKSAQFVS